MIKDMSSGLSHQPQGIFIKCSSNSLKPKIIHNEYITQVFGL